MVNYKTFLILPIFKNNKFSQNDIFNQKNFISRSSETRSLVSALDASIVFEKIITALHGKALFQLAFRKADCVPKKKQSNAHHVIMMSLFSISSS